MENIFEYLDKKGLDAVVNNFKKIIKNVKDEMTTMIVTNSANITLPSDLHVANNELTINSDKKLNLGGNVLSTSGSEERGDTIIITEGNVEIKNGKIVASDGRKDNSGVIRVEGSSNVTLDNLEIENGNCIYVLSNENPIVTINNCKLTTDASQAVYVGTGNGKVIINSGEFKATGFDSKYTLNLKDSLVNEDGSNVRDYILVKGGKFYNFDPSKSEGEPVKTVNFVADDFKVVISMNDENKIYEVVKKDATEFVSEIKKGGDFTLTEDFHVSSGDLTLTKPTEIDLGGNEMTFKGGSYGDSIVIGNGATVTISNGELKPSENASQAAQSATILVKTSSESHLILNDVKVTGYYPVYLNSANENSSVTINGGEFYPLQELNPAVYVGKGTTGSVIGGKVIINDGVFGQKGITYPYLLNVEDVLRKQEGKEPRDFIEVFGGKFYNFDPSNNKAEGEKTNFVADGYIVESEQNGEDIIYTVVKK